MIIGKKRQEVIFNIKRCVKEKKFNAKVEPDDPVLSKKDRLKLVEKFWANHNSPFSKAIITCNHYNQFDCLPLKRLAMKYHKRLYFVIEDTNLKLPNWIGFLMRNIDSIPVTASFRYLGRELPKHLNKIFSKKNRWIVVYPEQELWLNYRKPRPLQKGAYYYAAKMNVPIISCFVEIKDTNKQEKLHPEFNKTRWILHVLPTIYPDPKLSLAQNIEKMRKVDYLQKKAAYEKYYGKKLDYTFTDWDIAGYKKK